MNGPLAIALESIAAYCSLTSIQSPDDKELLLKIIRVLDPIWLDDFYTRQENKRSKASAQKTPRR